MDKEKSGRTCFVIAPIGEAKSNTRRRSDQVLKYIIEPVAKECGYETIRADRISQPGTITVQIIQHLLGDDLVVADLTEHNPNVFYELTVRHAVRKPFVQIIQDGESIPFDIAGVRTIFFDWRDLDSVNHCKEKLKQHIQPIKKTPTNVDTPISIAVDLEVLRGSDNPLERSSTEIVSMLQDLNAKVGQLRQPKMTALLMWQFFLLFDVLKRLLTLAEGEEPTRAKFDQALHQLRKTEEMFFRSFVTEEKLIVSESFMKLMKGRLSKRGAE